MRQARGSRLKQLARLAADDQRVIGLGGGLPSSSRFPKRALAGSFFRVIARQGSPALQYGWPEGVASLREKIAARLADRGAEVAADEVIVTSGAQQAIALATQIACKAGDRIAVDAATYPAALDLFRDRGLVPGVVLKGARAAYVMPALGNPHGQPLAPEARSQLLDSRIAVIEDDAYADLRFDGPAPQPLLADLRERLFHVGTFSKTLCPGLRVGYLVPPPRELQRALRLKQSDDLQASSLAQAIIDDYLRATDFDARLVRLRVFYRRRAVVLARAVRRYLPHWRFKFPAGGFALWLEPEHQVDEGRFLEWAIAEGVSFDAGSSFRADGATHPLALRLCFSHVAATALDEGVRRLARAWAMVRRTRNRAGPMRV